MADLSAGTKVGNYVIERLIGRGGFGAVYVAEDKRLGRRVALKVLDPALLEDERSRRRFVDESRLAASLDHPNIIPIYESGTAGGRPFLAMRYVPGPDLAGIIDRDGRLAPERVGRIVAQLASALDAAHGAGLVHRDVKPGNVLLASGSDGTDHAYLTDFGLSKRVGGTGAVSQTRSGQFAGTVGYVAPEQIKGRAVDGRADIYSLGCLAYHALTGQAPFARESEIDTLMAHVDVPAPSVHGTVPDIADRVDPVLARAMAKNPADRYPSASAFSTELSAAVTPRDRPAVVTRGFLFADLRGYTAFIETHGDAAAVELIDAYRKVVRDVIKRFGGAEIKTEGDSFYVVFPSASAAVEAGMAIVAAADAATAEHPDLPIRAGIGVHAGESSETAEGYVGSSVNIAARVCAQAGPGEVLITDTVRILVRTSLAVGISARGRKQLKGISEPVALFAVTPVETSAGGGGRRKTTGALVAPGGSGGRHAIWIGAAVLLVAVLGVGALFASGAFKQGSAVPSATPAVSNGAVAGAPSSSAPGIVDRIAYSMEYSEEGAPPCARSTFAEARLFTIAPDGSGRARPPTDLEAWSSAPAWSHDGRTLAYTTTPLSMVNQVAAVDLADGSVNDLTDFPDDLSVPTPYAEVLDVAWSGDDRHVAYLSNGLGAFVIDVATGEQHTLLPSSTQPELTPLPDGSDPVVTPRPAGAPPTSAVAIDWRADGRIGLAAPVYGKPDAETGFESVSGTEIWSVLPDGTDLRLEFTLPGVEVRTMAWSPDGARLAVEAVDATVVPELDAEGFVLPVPADILIVDSHGEGQRVVAAEPSDEIQPAWSPDGGRIVFADNREGHYELYSTVTRDTGIEVRVTNTPLDQNNCWPSWGRTAWPPIDVPVDPDVAQPMHRGRLEPGLRAGVAYRPLVQLRLEEGWSEYIDTLDDLSIRSPTDRFTELTIANLQAGMNQPCIPEGELQTTLLGPGPRDVIEWLRTRPEVTLSQAFPVNIAGHSGLTVDVEAAGTLEEVCGADAFVPGNRFHLFLVGDDSVWVRPGQKVRLWALDVDGKTVTILARAPVETFDTVMTERLEPNVKGLHFGEAPTPSGT